MKLKPFYTILFVLIAVTVLSWGCRKEPQIDFNPESSLTFSNDTIVFDTIFTTMGSITKQLRIYNQNKNSLLISRIELAGKANSPYQINVDGHLGSAFTDIELASGDSLYVFIRITIDPTNQNNPLLVKDSLLFELNGKQQDVDLYAWGQDAHFIMPNLSIEGLPPLNIIAKEGETVTWTNDKPYVIVGYAVVDSLASLIINAGTKIHFYNNSGLWIYKSGNIQVNGSQDNPVVFQGTRLDAEYADIPAQWDRIWINESERNSVFNYAVIQNGTIGIQAETLNESLGNKLILNNTKILNMSGWGIFSRFYQIEAANLLVANAGSSLLNLTTGGNYSFKNCTFANYWRYSVRKDPLLHLSDYYLLPTSEGDLIYLGELQNAYFGDCIFYGSLDDEILIDPYPETSNVFQYLFDHCLMRTTLETEIASENSLFNLDPLFINPYEFDFHLDTLSPAIDQGIFLGIPHDMDGVLRDANPDLGVYEYISQPKNTK